MKYRLRFTTDAQADLDRLYDCILEGDADTGLLAGQAFDAIRNSIALLETSPFSCRKATTDNAFLRELVIAFGSSGYVALFEIEDATTVTVLAIRHQREDDYH